MTTLTFVLLLTIWTLVSLLWALTSGIGKALNRDTSPVSLLEKLLTLPAFLLAKLFSKV